MRHRPSGLLYTYKFISVGEFMNILAVGDIVGIRAIEYLKKVLWTQRETYKIDFVVANAENASDIYGLSPNDAQTVLDCGVDLMTMGNHTFDKRSLYTYLDDNPDKIIRPVNYPSGSPGYGSSVVRVNGFRLLCINVQGTAFMTPLNDPFESVETVLEAEDGNYDLALLDIHAEATSEKYAIARYFDGRINMIFGTHTHVQTADEKILEKGSAYITDIGMTGPVNGILGTDSHAVITRMKNHMPSRFSVADGEIEMRGVIFSLDEYNNFKINYIRRIYV